MRPFIFALSILFTLWLNACQNRTNEHPSLTESEKLSLQLGNATLWFQKSAEMQMAYIQAYERGKMLLKAKLDTLTDSALAPAVVLDLDETVLDNSPYEAKLFLEGKNYSPDSWLSWCSEGIAKALPGAVDFLHFADSLGLTIFYISNRKIDVFEPTLKNLKVLKLPQATKDNLLLRTTVSDKTERRESVEADHTILLFVGDNLTDYSEEFAKRDSLLGEPLVEINKRELLTNFIILPNPMYGEWESAIYNNDFSKSAEEKLNLRREALDQMNKKLMGN